MPENGLHQCLSNVALRPEEGIKQLEAESVGITPLSTRPSRAAGLCSQIKGAFICNGTESLGCLFTPVAPFNSEKWSPLPREPIAPAALHTSVLGLQVQLLPGSGSRLRNPDKSHSQ